MRKHESNQSDAHLRQLTAARPMDADQLHHFVQRALGLTIPRECVEPGHTPPFAYLCHAYFEGASALRLADAPSERDEATPVQWRDEHSASHQLPTGETPAPPGETPAPPVFDKAAPPVVDCVVWANRGGGKTLLGAVATLLDLLFKPGIQVRILGGSLAQSAKMYEHLTAMLERPLLRPTLATEPTQRRIVLKNGSTAEILAQSQKAVRGVRVHKLRCDEIEQFDPDIWQAAQLVTRSGQCGDVAVTGSVEALSTMHRPGGLMSRLIGEALDPHAAISADKESKDADHRNHTTPSRLLFKWNALDVIERCPPARPCASCVLWSDCQGRAKEASGFVSVDDLVAQWHRTSEDTWSAEMLCRRPKRQDRVYPNFDRGRHVMTTPAAWRAAEQSDDADAPADHANEPIMVAGMDFGLRSPAVWLWALLLTTSHDDTHVHVIDAYQQTGLTIEQHLAAIERQAKQTGDVKDDAPAWVGIDPAGRQRSSHSGLSDVDVLRRRGLSVRARLTPLRDGIERIRRRLDRGTLTINPRCTTLIDAMSEYHFDPDHPHRDQPVKDGPDHACDALRYLIVNLELGPRPVAVRQWA